ncbi:SRA-YDG [Coprinopsis marcescibilis]|uniref:SRA-YDG n=1 Tax=Coprinopsis marcescibilis TaxID=230819 RepID=A0A5C3KJE5_COPMA|nr:SRA-YDG [Coprinopsis marcescibilis]
MRAGVHGSKSNAAYSIVLSGGHDDDIDKGDSIVFTGIGGRPNRKDLFHPAGADQTLENRYNAALRKSMENGLPVRVIRGRTPGKVRYSRYAPSYFELRYRYDGLYIVVYVGLSIYPL